MGGKGGGTSGGSNLGTGTQQQSDQTHTDQTSVYQPAAFGTFQNLVNAADMLTSQPFSPYGPNQFNQNYDAWPYLVAPRNVYEQQVLGNAGNLYQYAAPYIDAAGQMTNDAYNQAGNFGWGTLGNASNIMEGALPYIGQGGNLVGQGSQLTQMGTREVPRLSGQDIEQYMSPYQQHVINATMDNISENQSRQQEDVLGNAASRGALGGDRLAVAQSELARQQGLSANQTLSGLWNQNYQQALQTAQGQQQVQQSNLQRQLQGGQGMGQLGGTMGQLGGTQGQIGQGMGTLAGIGNQVASTQGNLASQMGNLGLANQQAFSQQLNALGAAGSQERAFEQQRLNAIYEQYLREQGFPFQALQYRAGIQMPAAGGMGGQQLGIGNQLGNMYGITQSMQPSGQGGGGGFNPMQMIGSMAGKGLHSGGRVYADGGAINPFASGGLVIPGQGMSKAQSIFPNIPITDPKIHWPDAVKFMPKPKMGGSGGKGGGKGGGGSKSQMPKMPKMPTGKSAEQQGKRIAQAAVQKEPEGPGVTDPDATANGRPEIAPSTKPMPGAAGVLPSDKFDPSIKSTDGVDQVQGNAGDDQLGNPFDTYAMGSEDYFGGADGLDGGMDGDLGDLGGDLGGGGFDEAGFGDFAMDGGGGDLIGGSGDDLIGGGSDFGGGGKGFSGGGKGFGGRVGFDDGGDVDFADFEDDDFAEADFSQDDTTMEGDAEEDVDEVSSAMSNRQSLPDNEEQQQDSPAGQSSGQPGANLLSPEGFSSKPTPPPDVIGQARQVALQGGPAAVSEFMRSQGYPQSGAWCGQFAASVIRSAGGTPPSGSAVASNWRNFGQPVDAESAQPGDIAVKRSSRFGTGSVPTGQTGSHVTFVDKPIDPATGRFVGLGGNQSRWQSSYPARDFDFRRGQSTQTARNSPNSAMQRTVATSRDMFDPTMGENNGGMMGASPVSAFAPEDKRFDDAMRRSTEAWKRKDPGLMGALGDLQKEVQPSQTAGLADRPVPVGPPSGAGKPPAPSTPSGGRANMLPGKPPPSMGSPMGMMRMHGPEGGEMAPVFPGNNIGASASPFAPQQREPQQQSPQMPPVGGTPNNSQQLPTTPNRPPMPPGGPSLQSLAPMFRGMANSRSPYPGITLMEGLGAQMRGMNPDMAGRHLAQNMLPPADHKTGRRVFELGDGNTATTGGSNPSHKLTGKFDEEGKPILQEIPRGKKEGLTWQEKNQITRAQKLEDQSKLEEGRLRRQAEFDFRKQEDALRRRPSLIDNPDFQRRTLNEFYELYSGATKKPAAAPQAVGAPLESPKPAAPPAAPPTAPPAAQPAPQAKPKEPSAEDVKDLRSKFDVAKSKGVPRETIIDYFKTKIAPSKGWDPGWIERNYPKD